MKAETQGGACVLHSLSATEHWKWGHSILLCFQAMFASADEGLSARRSKERMRPTYCRPLRRLSALYLFDDRLRARPRDGRRSKDDPGGEPRRPLRVARPRVVECKRPATSRRASCFPQAVKDNVFGMPRRWSLALAQKMHKG